VSADHEALATPLRPSALRALATFLVFVPVGPLVGLVTVTAVIALDRSSRLVQLATNPENFIRLTMLYLSLSYVFGGIPAALVGLVAAVTQYRSRLQRAPLRAVLLASFMAALIFLAAFSIPSASWEREPTSFITALALTVLGLHLTAGIVCWLIANGLLRLSGSRNARAAS
jgi:glucan phosphoethanolaminetransferase (alkaline phosphatase superfamily)